jgi:poly(hydroxyalkanoate) depolymerase family esterase
MAAARAKNLWRNGRHVHRCLSCLAAAILLCAAFAAQLSAQPREEDAFGSNPGNLRMLSHVPTDISVGAPLIVVLHGCKQRAPAFARDAGWLALADRTRSALLLPEQKGLPRHLHDVFLFPWVVRMLGANNQNACFNWFDPQANAHEKGEALSIRQMIDTMIARYAVDRSRVFIAGLSAGGAMTAAMLTAYPERFAGGAVVAGIPYGCADDAAAASRCMSPGVDRPAADWGARVRARFPAGARPPPVTIWHGDADERVVPRNRQELVEQWIAVHGVSRAPITRERNGPIVREVYADSGRTARVESVLVEGLGHAFPIETGGPVPCGQPGDFVVPAKVCASREIARFWGLIGAE